VVRGLDVGVHLPGLRDLEAVVRGSANRVVALEDAPHVIVTADGVVVDGVVRCLKDEVDDLFPGASRVIVVRNLGEAPLAATMDAYLDVEMVAGRDEWLDET
jgi:hypothetical protein